MARFGRIFFTRRYRRTRRWRMDPETRRRQRYDDDDLYTPRCPLCRYFLIARVNAAGPYFYCLCRK